MESRWWASTGELAQQQLKLNWPSNNRKHIYYVAHPQKEIMIFVVTLDKTNIFGSRRVVA